MTSSAGLFIDTIEALGLVVLAGWVLMGTGGRALVPLDGRTLSGRTGGLVGRIGCLPRWGSMKQRSNPHKMIHYKLVIPL